MYTFYAAVIQEVLTLLAIENVIVLYFMQERQQQVENLAPVKNYISECLDKLQSAMREKSTKVVAQRLEAITRKVG